MTALMRSSGILLHPSSLPGPFGHGDLGPQAYRFVDWLAQAGQHLWQMLPLSPPGSGDSPYMSVSVFAGNPLLVSPEQLHQQGLLTKDELVGAQAACSDSGAAIDFAHVKPVRLKLLRLAANRFFTLGESDDASLVAYQDWCALNQAWADDYALFAALADSGLGEHWRQWPEPLRHRENEAMADARQLHAQEMGFWSFVQWQFDLQWDALHAYAKAAGVSIIGDCPIYCSPDSVDVWQNTQLFQLDSQLQALAVAGVPPDYFSETGQLWGNPLYDWPAHEAENFAWWSARMQRALSQADIVRIDHFRGLQDYWAVPAHAETAVDGQWQPGPGNKFFIALQRALGGLPIIAEDLGTITPEVTALRDAFELPGMSVLQFAFGDSADNLYLPHNQSPNRVVYTGTHDNDTSVGWFEKVSAEERGRVQVYLKSDGREIHWDLIHAASTSVARMAIYPLQDVLGLGSAARLNEPGQAYGQWSWRFDWSQLQAWQSQRLLEISSAHGRHPPR